MAHLERSIEIPATQARVWSVVSDWKRETEFWKGVVSVSVISATPSRIERDVTIAFRNTIQREKVRIEAPSRIVNEILSGPMRGSKSLLLESAGAGTRITVIWDLQFVGFFLRLISGRIMKHVAKGTDGALGRIKAAVETGGAAPPGSQKT